MNSYSPGPWTAQPNTGVIFDGRGRMIGLMIPSDPIGPVEMSANWNLVSAAPFMLAALQAVEWGGSHIDFGTDHPAPACPFCNAMQSAGIHTDDCLMGNVLRRARDGAR